MAFQKEQVKVRGRATVVFSRVGLIKASSGLVEGTAADMELGRHVVAHSTSPEIRARYLIVSRLYRVSLTWKAESSTSTNSRVFHRKRRHSGGFILVSCTG